TKTNAYEKYTFDDTGQLLEKIYYHDGVSTDPAVLELGIPDFRWHKATEFTEELGDGNVHAKRDEIYTDMNLTNFVMVNILTYHDNGIIDTREVFDNKDLAYNTAYEKYTYDDTETLIEKIYYFDGASIDPFVTEDGTPDNRWHKASDFILTPIDNEIHARKDEIYEDMGLNNLLLVNTYTYLDTGLMNTKQVFDNVDLTMNDAWEMYTFDTNGTTLLEKIYYFDGTTIGTLLDPLVLETGIPDNRWHKSYDFTPLLSDFQIHARLDEVYNDMALMDFVMLNRYTYFLPEPIVRVREIFDNILLQTNDAYEKYVFDSAGNLLEKIYFYDGVSVDPGINEAPNPEDVPDNMWHHSTSFTGILGDGYIHPQDDLLYNSLTDLEAPTNLVMHAVYLYHPNGLVDTKELYNNAGTIQTFAYEKYIFDNTGQLLEKIYLFDDLSLDTTVDETPNAGDAPDNYWHRSTNFTGLLDDGQVHVQNDYIYGTLADLEADTNIIMYAVYSYFQSGVIETKELYDNSGATKTDMYEKYTFDDTGALLEKI
ncbi:MAG: hypothetical protein WBD17_02140, partial [Candidatus Omnitrophota bacterium]